MDDFKKYIQKLSDNGLIKKDEDGDRKFNEDVLMGETLKALDDAVEVSFHTDEHIR